jgi:hypothetical protein
MMNVRVAIFAVAAFLCGTAPVWAQRSTTLFGYVEDQKTGERLIGAYVHDKVSKTSTVTNAYGFYSLTVRQDSARLQAGTVGYRAEQMKFGASSNPRSHTFALAPVQQVLREATVVGTREAPLQRSTQMSSINLNMRTLKNMPVLFGEPDVLKMVQLLPGVKGGTEGTAGFYVRGGGPDQNLILIDGVPVYNVNHLFGFFSIFNGDAIQSVQLIKGGFPAEYGGRLSSVLDIRMKEGNRKEFHGEGAVGVIASRLTLEGPLNKKTSYLISGRRTYLDALAAPFVAATNDGNSGGYYFYDLNGKINHRFNDAHQLYLSYYQGADVVYINGNNKGTDGDGTRYSEKTNFGLDWGNRIGTARWNYRINPRLFTNTTATYSRYRFNTDVSQENEYIDANGARDYQKLRLGLSSFIEDYGVKWDADWLPNNRHTVKVGAGIIHHTFEPGIQTFEFDFGNGGALDTNSGSNRHYAWESAVYVQDDFSLTKRLKMNAGLHWATFQVGSSTYSSLQPRWSARYLINANSSFKASAVKMTQFLHLLTNQTIGLPTDLWVPVTDRIAPQQAWQVAAGYAHVLRNGLNLSVEGYYKDLQNLIEYKEGATFFSANVDWQDKVTTGRGWAYGTEVLLEKKEGNTTGWLGYTLAWANRQFDAVNSGNPYPFTYDRRHDVSLVVNHRITDKWTAGMVWVYGTGRATTLPTTRYAGSPFEQFFGTVEYVASRNNFREPAYHRMDLSFTRTKVTDWGKSQWVFSVYNAYNRINPFLLQFETTDAGRKLFAYSLFPIIPSVSYGFSF